MKELKHQLKMLEKELEIQRSLVMECEGEIELLSEEKNNLSEQKYSIMLPSMTVFRYYSCQFSTERNTYLST